MMIYQRADKRGLSRGCRLSFAVCWSRRFKRFRSKASSSVDFSLFLNYHATIINQLFNHHFRRFTRNRRTPKVLKTECFPESISLFAGTHCFFNKKTLDLFLKMPVSGPFTPPSEGSWDPGLQVSDTRVLTKRYTILLKISYMLRVKKLLYLWWYDSCFGNP